MSCVCMSAAVLCMLLIACFEQTLALLHVLFCLLLNLCACGVLLCYDEVGAVAMLLTCQSSELESGVVLSMYVVCVHKSNAQRVYSALHCAPTNHARVLPCMFHSEYGIAPTPLFRRDWLKQCCRDDQAC